MTRTELTTKFQTPSQSNPEQSAEDIFKQAVEILKTNDENAPSEARALFTQAVELRHAPSELALGLMWLNGQGGVQDFDTGMDFIKMSALKQYEPAIEFLALFPRKTPVIGAENTQS
ncbi:MAG: hypothetical protein WBK77_10005 [Alphaproteobacteria bacterium]